jgi:hypothetical protein
MTLVLTLPLGDIAGWVGAVTGILALTWQISTWRRSGHRVKVTRGRSYQMRDDAPPLEMFFVNARNVGSAPVTVTGWGVSLGKAKKNLTVYRPELGSTPLPHRLEPGAELNLYVQTAHVRRATVELGVPLNDMRAWVQLATGQKLNAKRGAPVHER